MYVPMYVVKSRHPNDWYDFNASLFAVQKSNFFGCLVQKNIPIGSNDLEMSSTLFTE
jgi:hypothetical protein